MSPTKNTATLTPAQQARTTLAKPEVLPAKAKGTAPNRRTRRSAKPESGVSLIIADEASKSKQADKLADVLASIGMANETTQRAEITWADEMARYRRMFPARTTVQDVLGTDQPDLLGNSEEYKQAWGKVLDAARAKLAEKFVTEFGMNEIGAAEAAKNKVESDRKNVSVRYRNQLEKQVREAFEKPSDRARFMLGHGFKFSTVVTGEAPCIPAKDSKLVKNEKGEYELVIPGHKVTQKGLIVAEPKRLTAGNQEGQGKEGATVATALQATIDSLKDATAKGDQLALLHHAQSIVNGLVGRVAPLEGTDLATRARALVEIERSLVRLTQHWGVTPEALSAARKAVPAQAPQVEATKPEAPVSK